MLNNTVDSASARETSLNRRVGAKVRTQTNGLTLDTKRIQQQFRYPPPPSCPYPKINE